MNQSDVGNRKIMSERGIDHDDGRADVPIDTDLLTRRTVCVCDDLSLKLEIGFRRYENSVYLSTTNTTHKTRIIFANATTQDESTLFCSSWGFSIIVAVPPGAAIVTFVVGISTPSPFGTPSTFFIGMPQQDSHVRYEWFGR